jgi:hypothetical protein
VDIENPRSEVGSTLNPQVRFFVFADEPNMERLVPPAPGRRSRRRPCRGRRARLWTICSGAHSAAHRRRRAGSGGGGARRPGRPSAEAVADLLWAVLMKPEFQLIY